MIIDAQLHFGNLKRSEIVIYFLSVISKDAYQIKIKITHLLGLRLGAGSSESLLLLYQTYQCLDVLKLCFIFAKS